MNAYNKGRFLNRLATQLIELYRKETKTNLKFNMTTEFQNPTHICQGREGERVGILERKKYQTDTLLFVGSRLLPLNLFLYIERNTIQTSSHTRKLGNNIERKMIR